MIDLHTADFLDRISESTRVPRAGFLNLKVVVTGGLGSNYRMQGRRTSSRGWSRTEPPRSGSKAAAMS